MLQFKTPIRFSHVIVLLLLFCTCRAQKMPYLDPDVNLSVLELKEDFRLLRSCLEKSHAGLYTNISKNDLDKAFDQVEASLEKPMKPIEFFRTISPLLKLIGNGHTKFVRPKNFMAAINSGLPRFPFAIHRNLDTIYVLRNLSEDESILPGTIIKSINGRPAIDWFKEIADNLSRDVKNTSYPERIVEKDFSGLYACFVGTPSTFDLQLINNKQEIKLVTIQGLPSSKISANAQQRYPDWLKLKQAPTRPPLSFEVKDKIGVLTIRSFSIPVIKKAKQKYKRFFEEVFQQVESQNLQNLVIDIRDNGGGYPDVIIELYSYLAQKPYVQDFEAFTTVKRLPFRKYYEYGFWENLDIIKSLRLKKEGDIYRVRNIKKKTFPLKPHNYTGELYMLINPYSFSASSDFLGMLRDVQRGIFIGQAAGGNPTRTTSWIMPVLELPHTKIKAIIPLVHMHAAERTDVYDHGIMPDYFVKNTIEEAIHNEDGVMKFALELISGQNNK